ncbi:tRNA lysidine(34) synthetase TilS [Halobacillus kuroshimensis]|uniref:tRNA(Ile)-lysidine synthase n=1 Tax=Halobacillus kuroshimensis TaxID=302481 RepID=A0ABS3E1W1_9BACI|nr:MULTISPECIES: tRNA lysidine(34) synthetase TilS [Halobacillus]MBN8237503.1 tRNA lysidine(34) synthetase TilS [Halobacillus kuroshimensis]
MDHVVHSFISKHQLIQPGQTVLAAVSGGPDSTALLHMLTQLREKVPFHLTAVSVDHGLRGEEAREDLAFVQTLADQWDVEFHGTSVDTGSYKESSGKGTQEAARDLRYRFFEEQMYARQADVLVMGHHGDDQAETLMMQMVRSARPEAVQGIPLRRPFACGEIVRPLLCVSKEQLLHYLNDRSLPSRHDPSNDRTDYTRNAFRHRVMPFLKEQNPRLHEHVQAFSERAAEERSYINEQAQKVLEYVHFSEDVEKFVQFSKQTFKTFPLALQRTAFHLILNYLYVKQNEDISYLHEEMFMNLLRDEKPNRSLDFPGGLKVVRAYDEITFTFADENEDSSFRLILHPGASVSLPDGSSVEAEWSWCPEEPDAFTYVCEDYHVNLPLIVRSRQPGDRMEVRGMKGSKKVKDIFIDQKIPARTRGTLPVVTDQTGEILWLGGLKKGGRQRGRSSTGPWLRLHYKNKADA